MPKDKVLHTRDLPPGKILFKQTPEFELENTKGERFKFIDLEKTFGFIPEIIGIHEIKGEKHKYRVSCMYPPDKVEQALREAKNIETLMIKTKGKENKKTGKKSS